MMTPYPFVPDGKLAYIRQIDIETLPRDIRSQIPGDVEVWGVHKIDGECIALTQDRSTAFFLAREHDLEPVSAH